MGNSILVTGGNGQLGTALKKVLKDAIFIDVDELDITDKEAVDEYDWTRFKAIINAAAYTNVDGAETEEGRVLAWSINATGTANLARVAAKNGITFIHISTDYVFDGRNKEHKEDENLSPLSVYGQTKAAADTAVSLIPKHYMLRTSWVVGSGPNFVRTMYDLGQKGIEPTVVSDQIGRLTFTSELAKGIDHLINNAPEFGIYNLTNSGEPTSWAEIAREIFKLAEFELVVTDTTTEDYFKSKPGVAPRPYNSTLNLDKIKSIGFEPRDWKENLKEYINEELKQ